MSKKTHVPVTPGLTPIFELEANSEAEAWENLKNAHPAFKSENELSSRGYFIEVYEDLNELLEQETE